MTRDPGDLSQPSRRRFLGTTASLAGGLVIACFVPFGRGRLFAQEGAVPAVPTMDPNAFVRIGSDNTITILIKHSEMGQGVATSLPMVVAEELDCDWSKVRMENAPNAQVYANSAFGIQGTGGSTSTLESFDQMRQAGAMARAMLVEAAAQKWKVDASACHTENGFVISGAHKASYGELAGAAAKLKAPAKVTLKDPSKWSLIGKPTRRIDSLAKVTGTAGFGMDVKRPGLLTGVIARAPVFGGKVKSFDASKAKAIAGVVDVVQVPSGVAVLAKHFWAAKKGRDALEIQWDLGVGATLSTLAMGADYRERAKAPGAIAKQVGDVDAVLKAASKRIEADYELPFLAHAPMEPLNCTVEIGKD
ncbi:MAG: molybdopterin cofactor-binding domain-containing protein, partial [Dokdonella sp.]